MLTRSLAALAAMLMLFFASGCSDDSKKSDDISAGDPATSETGSGCTYAVDGRQPARDVTPPPATPTETGKAGVTIKTTAGNLKGVLDATRTPCTVNSFLSLAEQGFYDKTPCPRLGNQPGFGILQCGDPTGLGAGGPGYSVQDELSGSETYPAGTLAMANSGSPDTNGSQFFLVFADSQFPPTYTVFGQLDKASIKILEGVAAKGDDGSNPAGGGQPNEKVDILDVVVG
jgi:peptidyl-prolyl cis-trans isomerase B (cyclophilin B)